jgi:WD40-like Beta Propeller Repeat
MSRKCSSLPLWIVTTSFAVALSLPAQTFSPWSKIENLGPVVNSASSDSCHFVTKSGLSLYFASNRPGGMGDLDLYVSQRATTNDPWGAPKSLGPTMNSNGKDHVPFITPDGHTMIFASDRAGGLGLNDLYASFRRNAADDFGWEAPVLIPELNSAKDDWAPWGFEDPTTGRLTLYFNSDRPGGVGGLDIYTSTLQADGKFSAPKLVPELSTSADDTMPTIREDGLELFLTSTRPGGLGGIDIWTSTRASTSDPWSTPVNVGAPVNTSFGEQRGVTFGDATKLYFFSGRSGGLGGSDLYQATRTKTTIIPVAGSATGVNGEVFRTSAQLSNTGDAEMSGKLLFHPAGVPAGNSDPQIAYRLASFESQTLSDLMASFGVTGIGSVEIVPDAGPAPASVFRIDNGGSVVVPAVDAESVLVTGSRGAVTMPSDTNRFRLNVGFLTLTTGVTMTVSLHESAGKLVRSTTQSFPPNYLVQMAASNLVGGAVAADQSIVFTIDSGSVVVFASTVANSGHASTLHIVKPITN